MTDELPRFLRVARAIALVSTVSTSAACRGATPPSDRAAAPIRTPAAIDPEPEAIVQGDPTLGSGPCRCSWDSNTAAAARVCKKGEVGYNGSVCVPGTRPKYPIAIGPLPPPDLPS